MTAGGGKSGYGVFRVGERLIGVPIGNLAEVCVVPGISKLMVPEGPLLGAFDLRDSLIPLVDIEALSGVPQRVRPVQKAAVLQFGDQVAAVALDEIINLTEARPTATSKGDPEKEPRNGDGQSVEEPLFPSGFVLDGEIVSCLDARMLFSRREVLSIANTRKSNRGASVVERRKHLIFCVGGAHFGIDTEHIWATVPKRPIDMKEVVTDGGICLGFIDHHGWRVPIVHSNRIFALGHDTQPREAEIVVLRFPDERLLGLNVDATERLSALPPDKLQPSSSLVAGKGLLPNVCVAGDGTQIFIIDYPALSSRADLTSLANLTARKAEKKDAPTSKGQSQNGATRESVRYLIFEAGCKLAVPAHQVTRILHVPEVLVPAHEVPDGVKGFFTVGDRSVPLISLPQGSGDVSPNGFVLLVTVGGRNVGFVADRICSMQTSELRLPGKPSEANGADLIQIRDGGKTAILPVAELATLAQAYAREIAPSASMAPEPGVAADWEEVRPD